MDADKPNETYPNEDNLSTSTLMLKVLDWLLDEQLAGRRPNTFDVADKFGMTKEAANKLHDELTEMGELG